MKKYKNGNTDFMASEARKSELEKVPARRERDSRKAAAPEEKSLKLSLTHFEGEIEFQNLSAGEARAILGRLRKGLLAHQATSANLSEHKVTFHVKVFRFVSNWNLLVPVDKGEITVQPGAPGTVTYRFSFVRDLVAITLMVIGVCVISLLASRPNYTELFMGVMVWLFLFGTRYLIAVFRLKNFVKRVVSE